MSNEDVSSNESPLEVAGLVHEALEKLLESRQFHSIKFFLGLAVVLLVGGGGAGIYGIASVTKQASNARQEIRDTQSDLSVKARAAQDQISQISETIVDVETRANVQIEDAAERVERRAKEVLEELNSEGMRDLSTIRDELALIDQRIVQVDEVLSDLDKRFQHLAASSTVPFLSQEVNDLREEMKELRKSAALGAALTNPVVMFLAPMLILLAGGAGFEISRLRQSLKKG